MESDFKCLRCGNCCRHAGEVRLGDGETETIAAHLDLNVADFIGRFTRLSGDRRGLALTEHPDGACVFLSDAPFACQIQAVKPGQCRAFPLGWSYADLESVCAAAGASAATRAGRPCHEQKGSP